MTSHAQRGRIDAAVMAELSPWPAPVALPVDVTDAEAFPEIARAVAHAQKMRGAPAKEPAA